MPFFIKRFIVTSEGVMHRPVYKLGIDLGSTTAKTVIFDSDNKVMMTEYKRHRGNIALAVKSSLENAIEHLGDVFVRPVLTGSAGMGIAEKSGSPFVQELVATAGYAESFHPGIKTLIDIGGEDSKIIFFDQRNGHDIRMNGNCAGGTGAFIDQMASLLGVSPSEMDTLSAGHKHIYPIASRCGVFAKTDVQNLISRSVPREDISASIFHALAIQIKNTLLRGSVAIPKIVFSGGPLTFLPSLRRFLMKAFSLESEDIEEVERAELIPASGAAVATAASDSEIQLSLLLGKLAPSRAHQFERTESQKPLFNSAEHYEKWAEEKSRKKVKRTSIESLHKKPAFLGIDSGSTTTKIILTDSSGRVAFEHYANNSSDPIGCVRSGLGRLLRMSIGKGTEIEVAGSCVTGYGEDLIRTAFNLGHGIVETMAHYRAAVEFDPNVSFVLDIGGQDMKAIFLRNGSIDKVEINEACSSGCGSFIETFANSAGLGVAEFADLACKAQFPADLGTRCTVFMNSKVKQSFREGATAGDISAGLAYSVVNNCLYKVLKIPNIESLGRNIVAQGGTFKNRAVLRALELTLGAEVTSPDISELMGAYGSALTAIARWDGSLEGTPLSRIADCGNFTSKISECNGCENSCSITEMNFAPDSIFYTGNRCEKVFSNYGARAIKGENFAKFKYKLLFGRSTKPATGEIKLRLGIPRVLNMYENFPFWAALFTNCGIELVLSPRSKQSIAELGAGTVASDNICFPAKLAHGHVIDLLSRGADRVFFPMVTYESEQSSGSSNCFNCPVVTGYPDVLRNSVFGRADSWRVLDTPNISFRDEKMLERAVFQYLRGLGVDAPTAKNALRKAHEAQAEYREAIALHAAEIIAANEEAGKTYAVIASRPYHIDPLINHGVFDIFSDFGIDTITEDAISIANNIDIGDAQVLTQWAYPNRLLKAAKFAASSRFAELIQLNSFGCGPDSIMIDEVRDILESAGKKHTLLRIDELSAHGSLKLRVRSFAESTKAIESVPGAKPRVTTPEFLPADKHRTILVPHFSDFHSSYITAPFSAMGYRLEILPPADEESRNYGLKYVNNEICYPATLVIGDILKALMSGKYSPDEVAVGITQTGGQCRASNYLSLIKKALVRNGFSNVPVVGVSVLKKSINKQTGFALDRKLLTIQGVIGMMFGDGISDMYYATAPRELQSGSARATADKYLEMVTPLVAASDLTGTIELLDRAVEEFNSIPIDTAKEVPSIGLIGEIYVKYSPYGNHHIVDKLVKAGVHVKVPPLVNMFAQWLVNVEIKHKFNIDNRFPHAQLAFAYRMIFNRYSKQFESSLSRFRFYSPRAELKHLAHKAEKLIDMSTHYYGEGWLIAGDIGEFAEAGIKNVLCLQPFGCIANHIVARGIEKPIRDLYPEMNVLFLDIDHGLSEVNLHNRLYLLLRDAMGAAADRVKF